MPFDLSAVSAAAQQVASQGEGQERRTYRYQLIYPGQEGTITAKFLFNPKSQSVARLIRRHKINGVNQPCARTWGQDCPICNALKEIENVTGMEHPQMASRTRGISFVQYVSSTYSLEGMNGPINQGDIVLLMYPWTIYKDLNQILQQAKTPEDLAQLVASNEGMLINVIHEENFKYSAQINPFSKHQTCANEQEFENFLNSLDSLNEQILPESYDQDMQNKLNEIAEELRSEYIATGPKTVNPNTAQQQVQNPMQAFQSTQQMMGQMSPDPQVQQVPLQSQVPFQPMNQPQQYPVGTDPDIPFNNGVQNNMAQSVPQNVVPVNSGQPNIVNGQPECFGRHGDPSIPQDQCLLCPSEISCADVSGR